MLQAEDGMTCLHLAAQNGKLNVVKFLVETHRIDVNIRVCVHKSKHNVVRDTDEELTRLSQ